MTHARQQLRGAVVSAITGLQTTGARVYTARAYDIDPSQLPGLEVNTIDETATEGTFHKNGVRERRVTVEIIARAIATTGLADLIDAICEQVEAALSDEIFVSGAPVDLEYQSTTIDFSGDGEQPVGRASMIYFATIFTAANEPGTLING